MDSDEEKPRVKDSISDFIDDDYYTIRQSKNDIENATWAIYIFAVVSLLFYVLSLFINHTGFNLLDCAINIILIAMYFCLGAYSNHKPFTAFIVAISLTGFIFLLEILLTNQLNLRGIVIKIIFIVYIGMRLKAARIVQQYEDSHPRQNSGRM